MGTMHGELALWKFVWTQKVYFYMQLNLEWKKFHLRRANEVLHNFIVSTLLTVNKFNSKMCKFYHKIYY